MSININVRTFIFPTLATQSVWSNLTLSSTSSSWSVSVLESRFTCLIQTWESRGSERRVRECDVCALQTQASIQTAGALKQAGSWKRGKQFVKLWVPADDSPGVSPACGYLVTLSSCAENSQHATGERPPPGFGCGESLKLAEMEGEKQPCRFFLTFVSADFLCNNQKQ